ncbi:MAG: PKD domain-containing protein [Bacteroidetes bacterium]|nr:MAG: PKD domain-containing protein [Bacteroidota bacterium]REK00685.1 MAG: PKD domain-containing protein [Bacteroidota bacterium]REK35193.1 MAG: PKD domain-containing protein [Bacteroidota bacterium]REK48270.1 MAG: PKD domain-containing protein [Bacteroidota bacterium]
MKKLLLSALACLALVFISNTNLLAQGTYTACAVSQTFDSTGTFYDTGGPTGPYQNSESCTLLINPPCATTITLSFQQFRTEANFDFFRVYDGTTTTAPQLLNASGGTRPSPVTATSGAMLIVWTSDISITDSGFVATWTSVIAPGGTPTAAIGVGNPNPPLLVDVQFNDLSAGGPVRWLWDFGDGDTAMSQNPLHAYNAPGTYTVTLIAYTCASSDTVTTTVTVQAAPQISVSPLNLTANALCGDSVSFSLDISNIGGGQLVYSTDGSVSSNIKVLAMSYGTDLFSEFPNTIAAINQHFTNYTLTTTATTNPGTLQGLLVGKNVLLIPEQETGNPAVWTTLGPVIRQYLNNGGSVVFCGSFSSQTDCMFNTGVFSGSYVEDGVGGPLTVVNASHPLAANVAATFNAPSATYTTQLSNADKIKIIDDAGNDVVVTRPFGSGKAIFLAFDYYANNTNSARVIANAIEWGGQNGIASWISLSRTNDTVTAPGTSSVIVTFQTTGLAAGTYISSIAVASNDPSNPVVNVPCTLTVTGDPAIALSDTCLNFGSIMQHTTGTQTFNIINNGCDTLHINSVSSTTSNFTVSSADPFVLPGGFTTATVNFSSSTVGNFNALIRVFNNDIDTVVCVSGSTFAAPVMAINPPGITQNLPACGATASQTMTISNTGGSDLTFNVGTTPPWLTISPLTGTITPGNSSTITLNFNSGTMAASNNVANVNITSNDPLQTSIGYSVTLKVDSNPCISFTYTPNTCTGQVDFTSSSINTPSTYSWDFGDGQTSNLPNPTNYYSLNGLYTVTLIACNSAGCDTMIQTVSAVITGPRATTCYPQTVAYCSVCGIGVTNVRIGNGINKTSFDAIDGYQDYTCTDYMTLYTLDTYTISITTGFTYDEIVKVWIDWNNDGILDSLTEEVFGDTALTFHSGSFTIPPGAVIGQPLRLRVASDFSGNPGPTPCLDLQFGQVEDYSVFVDIGSAVPQLLPNVPFSVYPNPFSKDASVEYSLNAASQVSIEIFNMLGEKIRSVVSDEKQNAGKHQYSVDGMDNGVYFIRLSVNGASATQKIVKM